LNGITQIQVSSIEASDIFRLTLNVVIP